MIIDFKMVEHPTISCFEILVKKLLEEGWLLHGNTIVVNYPTNSHPVAFIQAMYKISEEE